MEHDLVFYRRRLDAELAAAEATLCKEAKNSHRKLAELYARKIERIGSGEGSVLEAALPYAH